MGKYKKLLLFMLCTSFGLNIMFYQNQIIYAYRSWPNEITFKLNEWCIETKTKLTPVATTLRNLPIEAAMKLTLLNEHIVVSLTTTPYRIDKIQPVIQELLSQNIRINNIYLSVPYKFKRDNLEYVIPAWLQDEPRITILRTDDYGPATKLLGVLEQVQLPANAIIITIDDDVHYPDNLILHLAYNAKRFPNSAVALSGAEVDYDANGNIRSSGQGTIDQTTPDALVDVVSGFGGVAYRIGFFDHTVFDIKDAPKSCYIHDDFYISFYLAQHNIQRRIINSKLLSVQNIKWNVIGLQSDALFKITPFRADICKSCLAYLRSKHPNVDF